MFPTWLKPLSLYFRKRRNRRLVVLISQLHDTGRAPVNILDVGGSLIFWASVPEETRAKCRIALLNLPGSYEHIRVDGAHVRGSFEFLIGDARNLGSIPSGGYDLVVCSSVIEHVGDWADMNRAASEVVRVGRRGWVQVPALEFPIEQHFLLPCIHWLARPAQVAILHWLGRGEIGKLRNLVHHTRPLSRGDLRRLLPDARIHSEWLIFPKSHIATW